VPGLFSGLADVGGPRSELQEAFEFGVLIAVGGVDVDVQPGSRRPSTNSLIRHAMGETYLSAWAPNELDGSETRKSSVG
jgi:hypothetical protein